MVMLKEESMSISLEKMTKEEKLRMMEALWVDLTRGDEGFASPKWHEDVLEARQKRVQSGEEKYRDWDSAKEELNKRLK
jgi:Putative addiction module component